VYLDLDIEIQLKWLLFWFFICAICDLFIIFKLLEFKVKSIIDLIDSWADNWIQAI